MFLVSHNEGSVSITHDTFVTVTCNGLGLDTQYSSADNFEIATTWENAL